jgi:hypothetical protein
MDEKEKCKPPTHPQIQGLCMKSDLRITWQSEVLVGEGQPDVCTVETSCAYELVETTNYSLRALDVQVETIGEEI